MSTAAPASTPAAAAAPRLAARPWSRPAARPWWLALGLWLALAALAALALWHLRREALDGQERELGLLSMALTDEIDRGLRGAEEGLNAMRAELGDGRLPLSGPQAELALKTRAELMPLVGSIWIVAADGRTVAASGRTPAPPLQGFLPALAELPADTVALGRPYMPSAEAEPEVPLALRFDHLPRVGAGWIVATMPAATLLGAFSAALPAADARMAVFRRDGARLASRNVGRPTQDEAAVAQRLANRPPMALRTFTDGSQNLVGLHEVARYGVTVVVSRDLQAALQSWRGAAELSSIAVALLGAIMALALHLVLRADRRRAEAQQALQAQLARASKLESLGTLAGGVAHDFNNVLAGIVGFGEMAQDAAAPGSAQARHLDKVLQAALRGKALVERILSFSRGGARASTVFELQPVVEEVLGLLSASLRPRIVLERDLEAAGARLRGDATQAFEAVMNLCTNAMQAMPEGGMLSVRLARAQVATPRVLSHSQLAPGDYLALSVSDQGGGITPAVMERLFEPFFTTRGAQSGTGLGLAVVHGVVAEFGGAIDVRSTPGRGARFTLYLPECRDALPAPVAPQPAAGAAGRRRLLVVDDEPELVGLALELLQGMGYEPEGYVDAPVALEALRTQPQRYAAVITDEVMPELSGVQMTQALRAQGSTLPVLLVSGYGGALLAQRAAAAGVTRVLAKPLQRADLARALQDVLH